MLTVTQGVPPTVDVRHAASGRRRRPHALRIQVDGRAIGQTLGCPLVIDLYRDSERVIDGVVIYSAVDPP